MKTISLIALLIVAAAQLFVPSQMIMHHENILKEGKEFHFITAPIDPNDPFRGKYIRLSYKENQFAVSSDTIWQYGESIFVTLESDSNGFAKIVSVEKEAPSGSLNYVKAKVSYSSNNGEENYVVIEYPFETFYMEETKAPAAETVYHDAVIDSNQVAYAIVKILHGEAIISDVVIDGISIQEISGNSLQQ